MPIMEYEPLYNAKELTKVLKIGINGVYELLSSGKLPYLLINGGKKVRGSDLERFIETYPVATRGEEET
ncbi:helix-turn-helix domain-containing protein [Lacrimispora sp. NSJ-141]|uniref:Helix-turn-helix domain-containing protein n=1 Tax=Lientehia hominis TaxID=2897778 RepID=A0AAP2RIC4_9FIRM|nr:helix-turn-helix domain-containing protein [Lientehia hominis]MCD2492764.1 helix-turn-helix domain-containing protein [Lientehia hominis]